jgi:hypothetical protein
MGAGLISTVFSKALIHSLMASMEQAVDLASLVGQENSAAVGVQNKILIVFYLELS